MIGNDVVDLELSKMESNWQRKGFLDKVFTKKEQQLIHKSENHEITVWNLWSRKEAAYKVWNRKTGIRKFNPIQFECLDLKLEVGKVVIKNLILYTKTEITSKHIYTIAVTETYLFDKIIKLKNSVKTTKIKGLPFYIDEDQLIVPISITHHGKYKNLISIKDLI